MERKKFIRLVFATSMVLSACSRPTQKNVPPQTILAATQTSEMVPLPTPALLPAPTGTENHTQTIINRLTGAIYSATANPDVPGGRCVVLGRYTDTNKQDVVGAATALGPDPAHFGDYPRFKVFGPDHSVMGSFTTDKVENAAPFRVVQPGTIVCED